MKDAIKAAAGRAARGAAAFALSLALALLAAASPAAFRVYRPEPTAPVRSSLEPARALKAIGAWVSGLAGGDGFVYVVGQTRWDARETMPRYAAVSFFYVVAPGLAGISLGIVLGIAGGSGPRRRGAGLLGRALGTLYAVPEFILALALQLGALVALDALGFSVARISSDPRGGPVLALPFMLMAFYPFAFTYKAARRRALEAAESDYVRYARAKGLGEALISRRHLGAAVIPEIRAELPSILSLMQGNLFMCEYIFALPGVTRLLFTAAFPGRGGLARSGEFQYPVAALVVIACFAVYAAAWGTYRIALAVARRGLSGER